MTGSRSWGFLLPRHARLLLTLALAGASPALSAAELWMFSSPNCGACQQFEREVGDRYARTAEGRRIPLHRIGLHAPRPPQLADIAEVRGTPTFVLLDANREIGRITGYSSDELFWMRLAALIADIGTGLAPHWRTTSLVY